MIRYTPVSRFDAAHRDSTAVQRGAPRKRDPRMLHPLPTLTSDDAPTHGVHIGRAPFFRGLLVSCIVTVPFWSMVAWLVLRD